MLNLSNLEKLTIVIFTYNRHEYLKRTLNYWSSYNVKVLILDGSSTKFEDPCLNFKNIRYIYDPRSLYDRLLSSVDYIDTEFMILASDDEFYIPSALSTCVNFLSTEPSFSSCGGRAVGFRTKKKKIFGINQYPKLRGLCLDHDISSDRISKHFSSYVPAHFYSVIRTNNWKIISLYVFQKKYSFLASFELQVEFLIMLSGKSKIFSELMWMRNNELPHIGFELEIKIQRWWYDKKFGNEKKDFLQRMNKACNEILLHQNSTLNEHKISELFKIYIDKTLKNVKKNFFRKLLHFVPFKIKQIIKFFKRWYYFKTYKYRSLVNEKNLSEEINALELEGVLVNHKELNKITSILTDPNNND
jgi:glycosyltransferase domain-containing protein